MDCKLGLIILLVHIYPAASLTCDRAFTYYEEFGQYSFNVTCDGITKGNEHVLENITINNEIALTIANSVMENITESLFQNVVNIRILNIINSALDFESNCSLFQKLSKLSKLDVENTKITIDTPTLNGLNNLKQLILKKNSITSIESGSFQPVQNVEILELTQNYLSSIKDLPLCELKKLKRINLSRNKINDLKNFYFSCKKNPLKLDVNVNSVTKKVKLANFNVAASYDLVHLDLSYNQILDVGYSLDSLEHLRVLDLGHNRIVGVRNSNFKWLFQLERLNLSYNQLVVFDQRIFIGKTQLRVLDMSHNNLENFIASDGVGLSLLDISFNNLSVADLRNFSSLTQLSLQHNQLKDITLEDADSLETLNLDCNNLELSSDSFRGLFNLKQLIISGNSLEFIPDNIFTKVSKLESLDLSKNHLQDLNFSTFHNLNYLQTLNLSSNLIQSLSYVAVEPLKSLHSIDLSSNQLVYIEYDQILNKLPGLTNINIKSNILSCEDLGQIISFLKNRHIGYTSTEHVETLNQNVAGIPCRSATRSKLIQPKGKSTLFSLGVAVLVLFGSILTGIASYRFYIYLKRRKYRAEEFQLVQE